jgi:hypothetical protein
MPRNHCPVYSYRGVRQTRTWKLLSETALPSDGHVDRAVWYGSYRLREARHHAMPGSGSGVLCCEGIWWQEERSYDTNDADDPDHDQGQRIRRIPGNDAGH